MTQFRGQRAKDDKLERFICEGCHKSTSSDLSALVLSGMLFVMPLNYYCIPVYLGIRVPLVHIRLV